MTEELISIWNSLPADMRPSVLSGLVTLVTAIVGVAVVFWQIGRQARNAIYQSRHTESLKLKMDLYKQICDMCKIAVRSEVDLSSFVSSYSTDLKIFRDFRAAGHSWLPPKARSQVLMDRKSSFDTATIEIISFVERWGIIDSRIDVFKDAINSARFDIDEAYTPYFQLALPTMPQEQPGAQGLLFPWNLPSNQVLNDIELKGERLEECIHVLGGYLFDLQVEMQNLLLGEMFESRLSARKPIDPRFRVVRLSRHRRLRRYFKNETGWGKSRKETEEAARAAMPRKGWRGLFCRGGS